MNVICLMGRLVADPELKSTPNGVSVTSFCIAVDRSYQPKGQERQTDFINCVAWRNTAEFITRFFRKGQRIALQGSLQSRNYQDREGNKRTAYEVVIDNASFVDPKSSSEGAAPRYDSQVPQYAEPQAAFSNEKSGDFEEILGDDDLPF